MSGVDEQNRVFNCPKCGEIEYWILKTSREGGVPGMPILLGFLNNLKASRQLVEKPVLLQIMKTIDHMTLQRLLAIINRVTCPECRHSVILDSPMWKQISMEIEKGWERRGFA